MKTISRRRRRLVAAGVLVVPALLIAAASAGVANAENQAGNPVSLLTTSHVTVNGVQKDPVFFDTSWADNATGHYYLADPSNNAIDEFNVRTGAYIGQVGQGAFHSMPPAKCVAEGASSPFDCGGPNGIVTDSWHRIWASDGVNSDAPASSIKVMAPTPGDTVIKSIPIGGKFRSDELAYDARDQMILLANPDYADGFVTWINARTLTVAGRYTFPKPADPNAWGGIGQSVWDPATGLFYTSIPGVADSSGNVITPGKIDVFAPWAGAPVRSIPTPGCINGPAGLTLGPEHELIAGCDNGTIIADTSGHVRGMIPQLGGADEIWYNPADGNLYAPHPESAGSGMYVLGVADALTGQFLGNLPLPGTLAHSVAASGHHIFVPVSGLGVDVFTSNIHASR